MNEAPIPMNTESFPSALQRVTHCSIMQNLFSIHHVMKPNKRVTNEYTHPKEVCEYSSEVPTPIAAMTKTQDNQHSQVSGTISSIQNAIR